ncbi:hypothetical protein ONE63_004747 [Megalurothrips usitatus]|uniref:YEATS domain-containing protein n=1 Tax=Megalurothrips usitatus TaxID=439358 RepID=A0AAV7X0P3_9NEOP|nr:hypothetical protein ONE63_004747 [Megalurothrips usitatus]
MSCQKRKAEQLGKEFTTPNSAKRTCFQEEIKSPNKRHTEQVSPRNLRAYSDQEKRRIYEILEAEFDKELQAKEEEVLEIQERIIKTQRVLQYLCYAVVSDFYSREKTISTVASTRQRRIHPAVKKLLSGKGPPGAPEVPQNVTIPADCSVASSSTSSHSFKRTEIEDDDILARVESPDNSEVLSGKEKKVPRYIPPKPKPQPLVGNQSDPVRGGQNKVKTILVVGNVSKWLQADMRDDSATHKWMVYVRGPKGDPDISGFVSKVRFFLHPSYRPNDVVQVVCPPFHLSRRGWGEFPIRVQVHFSNSLNKPVDIIHNLKLDRTHCGFQTLGSETVAEVWIHRESPQLNLSEQEDHDDLQTVKTECVETNDNNFSEEIRTITASPSRTCSSLTTPIKTEAKEPTTNLDYLENLEPSVNEERQLPPNLPSGTNTHQESQSNLSENVSENFHSTPSSAASVSRQGKPLPSVDNPMCSPTKPTSAATLPSPQQSPSKAVAVNTIGIMNANQKLQLSPNKPGTQLVKCVDSKGAVRFLQVRTDLLPKILKRGSATIPVTPPTAGEGSAKVVSATQTLPQTPATQLLKAIPQTTAVKTATQSLISQVPPQNAVMKVVQQSPLSQPSLQSAAMKVLTPNAVTQVLPSAAVTSPLKIQGAPAGMTLAQGPRPVLRLVRPAGNANARPLLVAGNSTIRLPASAAGNGNRPLLVLKDGKLFMMKSALDAATKQTAGPVTNANVPSSGSMPENTIKQLLNESVPTPSCTTLTTTSTRSLLVSSTSKVSSVVTPSANSNSNATVGLVASENVPVTYPNNQPVVAVNPGVIPKPRSCISIPPAIRFSSPIGDQAVQIANSKSSAPQTQAHSILNPNSRVAVKSGKSLLKPAVSLLKANVGSNNTASKIVGSSTSGGKSTSLPTAPGNPNSLMKPPIPVPAPAPTETLTTNKRIILGRTSGSSTITSYSQLSILFRERFRSMIQACPRGPRGNMQRAVRWLINNLPLVSGDAKHLEFRILHPYCASDERKFSSWNIGKQRACEWQRAKTVLSLLVETGWDIKNVVTIKDIVIWARIHGYTPGLTLMKKSISGHLFVGDADVNSKIAVDDFNRITPVEKWLEAQENSSSSVNHNETPEVSDESDDEVDVVSCNTAPSSGTISPLISN